MEHRLGSTDVDELGDARLPWVLAGAACGAVLALPAIVHMQGWSWLVIVGASAVGGAAGFGVARVAWRLGRRSWLRPRQTCSIGVAVLIFGAGQLSASVWNWLYPTPTGALEDYGSGCLVGTVYDREHAQSTSWELDKPLVTVTGTDGTVVRFAFHGGLRAELMPADPASRRLLADVGCR